MADGEIELTPEQREALTCRKALSMPGIDAGWNDYCDRAGRPRAGGLRPDPGHEATAARREVAALAKQLVDLEGAHNRIVKRVHEAEDEQTRQEACVEDLAGRIDVLKKVWQDQEGLNSRMLDSLVSLRVRVEALEAAVAREPARNVSVPETDALLARAGAFLRALKRSATAVPVSLWPEYEALLLELDG